MNSRTIGLNVAESVFKIHGGDEYGKGVLRKQLH